MRDRLIQQVITEHRRLIAIARCQSSPDGDQVLLFLWTIVEPGISRAVIDVRARLPARCCMQVKDHINIFGAAPPDQPIQQWKAFRVVALNPAVMQWTSTGVDPRSV